MSLMGSCSACGAEAGGGALFCPYCGAALGAPVQLGEVLDGRYLVSSLLGRGGTATVYHGQHQQLGRDVAVKVLHPELSANPEMMQRFMREAQTSSRIDHPNVVRTYDFAQHERGFYYLVLEYIPGRALADALKQSGPLPFDRGIHVLAQIAAALDRCHELDILHRDLKTENVMLTTRGSDRCFVKVVDLGLARPLDQDDSDPRLTAANSILGTPVAMAPEQWNGAQLSARTDVYALGVLAYELFTGRPPFVKPNVYGYMLAHLHEEPEPPSQRVETVAPAVDEFILKALSKDPGARFSTMKAVMAALGRLWESCEARPSSGTTYSQTQAAPPPRRDGALPDPTVYASAALDLVWDVPSLCDEIVRLHQLRSDRLKALVSRLWRAQAPTSITRWYPTLEQIEVRLEQARERVHGAREKFDAEERMGAEVEASLRSRVMQLSFASRTAAGDAAELTGQRRTLERRLARFDRQRDRARAMLEGEVEDLVRVIQSCLTQMEPIFDTMMADVRSATSPGDEASKHLRQVSKVDGAIASYGAILHALDEMVEG